MDKRRPSGGRVECKWTTNGLALCGWRTDVVRGRCRGGKEGTDGGSPTEMCNVHGRKRISATMDGQIACIVLQNKAQRVTTIPVVANQRANTSHLIAVELDLRQRMMSGHRETPTIATRTLAQDSNCLTLSEWGANVQTPRYSNFEPRVPRNGATQLTWMEFFLARETRNAFLEIREDNGSIVERSPSHHLAPSPFYCSSMGFIG